MMILWKFKLLNKIFINSSSDYSSFFFFFYDGKSLEIFLYSYSTDMFCIFFRYSMTECISGKVTYRTSSKDPNIYL